MGSVLMLSTLRQLNQYSFLKVYSLPDRPLSDPVIVHVCSFEEAKQYYNITDFTIIELLAKKFWPGPLTIVGPANLKLIPEVCCANTGCVGIRCPNNPIALQLIKESGFPIGAPSANKFGHISPSQAMHVYSDFKDSELAILDGGQCSFGIESTVCKIDKEGIIILRKGGISELMLSNEASKLGIKVWSKSNIVEMNTKTDQISPGQYIRHYSPNIPTFLLGKGEKYSLDKCVLIDFGAQLEKYKKKAKLYIDLSVIGDVVEAINNLYNDLRMAECCLDALAVLICNLYEGVKVNKDHLESLCDRVFRAASGTYASII